LTHCGQSIHRQISKFDATGCQIVRLKCTKFDFRRGSAPDPAGRANSAPQTPPGWRAGEGGEGKGREEEGREGRGRKERGGPGPQIFWPRTVPAAGVQQQTPTPLSTDWIDGRMHG